MSKNSSPLLSFSLVFIIIIAVIAGFLGGLMSGGYLPNTDYSSVKKTLSNKPPKNLNKNVIVSYEDSKNLSQSIIGIYLVKNTFKGYLSSDNFYNYSEAVGHGLVFTSDGWAITVFDNFQDSKKYVAITNEGRIFPLNNPIVDVFTGLSFFRLEKDINGAGINDFNVFKVGDSDLASYGEEVYFLNRLNQVLYQQIQDINWDIASISTNIIKDTDKNSRFILLSGAVSSDFYGSPLLNSEGEMIGILKFDHKSSREIVIPINTFKEVIGSLLRENKIKRPSLGLYYLDLSKNYGLNEKVVNNINKGALVWNKEESAFKLKSPAKLAGLEDKDIIQKVEGEEINSARDLTSLIQEYNPNDQVKLTILRRNAIKEIKVVLGEM